MDLQNHCQQKWWEDADSLEAVSQLIHAESVLLKFSLATMQPINESVTLELSLFPKGQYELVLELQTVFNSLIDAISQDHKFLV